MSDTPLLQQTLHWISATYFLSATLGDGRSVHYDHVARVERFAEDFADVMVALGVGSSSSVCSPNPLRDRTSHSEA